VLTLVFVIWTATMRSSAGSDAVAAVIVVAFFSAILASRSTQEAFAFWSTAVVAALLPVWVFSVLWPNVLPARNDSALSLTVHNASSTPYTLKVMTVVALIFTPLVLVYQAWTYWVFRARVSEETVASGFYGSLLAKAKSSS
jgi:cytochrome d ubiquinol oxidase subunit II